MNILTEITSLLTNENKALGSALYKLKLVASRIKNTDLLSWINKELNGYDDEDVLPKYRIIDVQLVGAYSNPYKTTEAQPIPTFNFPEWLSDYCRKLEVRNEISSISALAKSDNETMAYMVPAELSAYITNIIRDYNPTVKSYNLINLQRVVSIISYKQLITRVRNYALDLVLAMEDEMGYNIDIKEIIKDKSKVNQIVNNFMTQNIISNIGDGSIINVGDNNQITSTVTIKKDDFEQLKEELLKLGLDQLDIKGLKESMEADSTEDSSEKIGPQTKSWIKRASEKVVVGGKLLSAQIATNIITEFLFSYWGLM